jgi:hypothetical protein
MLNLFQIAEFLAMKLAQYESNGSKLVVDALDENSHSSNGPNSIKLSNDFVELTPPNFCQRLTVNQADISK